MVSIVIVGAIMGMSVAIFETAKNKKTAETVAREVADKLAEAHADAMVPLDTKTELTKVTVECSSNQLIEKYDSTGSPDITLYTFPSKVTFDCDFNKLEFNANSGINLGKINVDGNSAKISVTKNNDTYDAKIDTMSGAVNVEKQP
jgi:hypothetical protein